MEKNRGSYIGPLLVLIILVMVFFWKIFFRNLILMPGDLMVGSYFPWLEQKWGYITGVSVKNPLMSDVFSQFYVWKLLIADAYKNHVWPLWNQNSYSGYPLLANFNSAALNPFNIFLMIGDFVSGWNYLVISQVLGSLLTMYWALTTLKLSRESSLIGAIAYGFSGFMLAWMENVTVGGSMVWLPLIIVVIEKYFSTKNKFWLWLLPIVYWLIIVSGFFQTMVYAAVFVATYFGYRGRRQELKWTAIFGWYFVWGLICFGLGSIQLLPTIELMQRSVRFSEGTLLAYNFGLSPLKQLLTLVAPDYFGNPATGNYTGFINYMETLIYVGIVGIWALIGNIYRFKKIGVFRFFVIMAGVSLLVFFDTPIGRLIYDFKLPLISTSGAGRVSVMFTLAVSILIAKLVEDRGKWKTTEAFKWMGWLFLTLIVGAVFALIMKNNAETARAGAVALRNLAIPLTLISALGVSLFWHNRRWWVWLITVVLIIDLFRFGWKFVPMVERRLVFPRVELLDYIKSDNDVFRVDKEKGPLLPPNTWSGYSLMSPSGYDPMAIKDYAGYFQKKLNMDQNASKTRYSEIEQYNATALGEFNVKYLIALKRKATVENGGESLNFRINLDDWKVATSSDKVVLLENRFVKPRSEIINDVGNQVGQANVTEYKSNKVTINYNADQDGWLVVRDSWYPGWTAYVNGTVKPIDKFNEVFRKVKIEKGKGTLTMIYEPKSFAYGLSISAVTFGLWICGVIYLTRSRKRRENSL